MTQSDLIAVAGISLTIQATYLAVLLPLFYTLIGVLMRDLPTEQHHYAVPTSPAARIVRYYISCDTLINLSAGLWLADILIGLALMAGFTLANRPHFEVLGFLLSVSAATIAVMFVLFSWFIIFQNYSDPTRREHNLFCLPASPNAPHHWARLVFGAIPIAVSVAACVTFLLRTPLQPRPGEWTPQDVAVVVTTGALLATLTLVGWLALGWYLEPFAALRELATTAKPACSNVTT